MSKTQMEKIQAFNASKAASATQKLETPTSVPNAQEKLAIDNAKSNTEIVADKANQKVKTQAEIEAEQVQLQQEAEAEQLHTMHQLTDATSNIIDSINERVNPMKDWIASQPTAGGIAGVLILIAFIALVAIPVNAQGQTRAYLFWQSLVGRTHMKYRESINTGGTVNGASADFGKTTNATVGTTVTPTIDLTHLNLFGMN